MKACTQCGKEIKKAVVVNKEIVCRECADIMKVNKTKFVCLKCGYPAV
uniref:RNA-binding protein n=1 Tax=viral metagenome TaxID=1070528 RepID=A0A6M3JMA1_9ZZZZ